MSKQTNSHVILKPHENVEFRLPIEVLMHNPAYKKQRDLFLQAFAVVQQRDFKDPKSFYAVAGIHGKPFVPYDRLPDEKIPDTDWHEGDDRWGGYCHHGDILFPTWHRPYVLLLEMLICQAADDIVNDKKNYPPGEETEEYKKESKKIRFPYWDWASPSTLTQGIPSSMFDKFVFIDNPIQKKFRIRNPLRAFTLPEDLGSLIQVGDVSNPTQRPYKPDADTTPYTPKGYGTVRHPNGNYITDSDATNLGVFSVCGSILRPNICQIFLVDKWHQFSNHGNDSEQTPNRNYGHYSSIEVVHDVVHVALGGNGGHMSYPDIAGFDPIFFLHHSNVDRILAIWQACHPNVWIIGNNETGGDFVDLPNQTIDENTELAPFHKTENTCWTSKEVRTITDLGYNYPDLEKSISPQELLLEMLDYYHPNQYLQYHWKLTLAVQKNKVGAPFQIRIFLDLPTATASTPITIPNYAGFVPIFARGTETQCANCNSNSNSRINGSVDLTTCMQRLFIDLDPETDDNEVAQSLEPNQITLVAVLLDGTGKSLEDAGLITADYWVFDEGLKYDRNPENWTQKHVGKVYPPNTS